MSPLAIVAVQAVEQNGAVVWAVALGWAEA